MEGRMGVKPILAMPAFWEHWTCNPSLDAVWWLISCNTMTIWVSHPFARMVILKLPETNKKTVWILPLLTEISINTFFLDWLVEERLRGFRQGRFWDNQPNHNAGIHRFTYCRAWPSPCCRWSWRACRWSATRRTWTTTPAKWTRRRAGSSHLSSFARWELLIWSELNFPRSLECSRKKRQKIVQIRIVSSD